jgi:penicillin-binding protein 1A
MANAYATIASGGVRHDPVAIIKVVHPSGRVDDFSHNKGKRVFSDGVTAEATKILKANVQSGTGTHAAIQCPAAGKTGTTSDYKDAWFVGFTPHLATSVWVGYANPPIPMRSVHGIEVAGGTFPSEIWHDYMTGAVGGDCQDFPPPKHAFGSEPFFGSYSGTGRGAGGTSGTGTSRSYSYRGTGSTGGTGTGTGGGGTGNRYNDPSLYQSPPQAAPKPTPAPAPKPAPTPSPNNGNGGAGGGGKSGGGGGKPTG